jgi:hypothetical protein
MEEIGDEMRTKAFHDQLFDCLKVVRRADGSGDIVRTCDSK